MHIETSLATDWESLGQNTFALPLVSEEEQTVVPGPRSAQHCNPKWPNKTLTVCILELELATVWQNGIGFQGQDELSQKLLVSTPPFASRLV